MPLSVRLDKKTESLLEDTASILKTSKSDVIKKSLSEPPSLSLQSASTY